jgi:PST family polysaccharide transporter
MGLGVWGLVLGRYASIVVELAVIWALVGWRPRWAAVSIGMWRSLARYGRHIFAASFITQSRTSAVTALLGRFVSIGAIGQLRYATTMVTLPRAAWVMSSSYVVFPAFARIAGDRERFRSAFGRTLRWSAITTFPASAMLLPLGPSIAVCLLGDQWRTAGYAAMALTGVQIAGGLGSVLSEGVKGLGRPDVLSKAAVVNSVATIALSVAFLPLGITGVAGASSVGSAISIVYMTRLALPVLGVDAVSILRALRPPFVATSLMVAVLFPLEWLVVHADRHGSSAGILLLLGEGTVGLVVYLCALRVLDPDAIETLRRVARSVGARVRGRRDVRAVA